MNALYSAAAGAAAGHRRSTLPGGGRPKPLSDHVQRRMEEQPRRDTTPEMALRSELHGRGLRYRVDAPLPMLRRRRADLLFRGPSVAVFVDGCFWHRCPEHGNLPSNNRSWWRKKLDRNVARDRNTDGVLSAAGWTSVRIWEHEIRDDVMSAADKVEAAVRGHSGQGASE